MKKILLLLLLTFYAVGLEAQTQKKAVMLDQASHDFRFSAGGGFAFRLGQRIRESDPKLDQLSKDLMHGFNMDFDAQYFFKDLWGLGINANYVQCSANGTNLSVPNIGVIGKYKETQKFFFIGPTVNVRGDFDKFLLISNFGLGPLFYTNDASMEHISIIGTQTAFAYYAGISGEYKISRSMGAGLKLSYTYGSIGSLNYNNDSIVFDGTRFSVSNFMITAFLSFRTWE